MSNDEHNFVTIIVADDGGTTATVEINRHAKLGHLLRQGLKDLYGEPGPNRDDYELVIGGTVAEDLDRSLEQAGLGTGSEVAILRKELPRG
jgi:hypothetical protein